MSFTPVNGASDWANDAGTNLVNILTMFPVFVLGALKTIVLYSFALGAVSGAIMAIRFLIRAYQEA